MSGVVIKPAFVSVAEKRNNRRRPLSAVVANIDQPYLGRPLTSFLLGTNLSGSVK